MRAEIRPASSWRRVSSWVLPQKVSTSLSSLQKARSTRTPVRFCRVAEVTWSRPACTCLYLGMVISIMPNTITQSTGITPTNTSAAWASMVKAMIMAPNTTKGDRSSRRRHRFTPLCT